MSVRQDDRIVGARGAVLALLTAAIVFGGLLLPACSAQQETAAQPTTEDAETMSPDEVLARVGGEEITFGQIQEKAAPQLEQVDMQLLACQAGAEEQRNQVIEASLRQAVQDRVLEAEAKERGVTAEELVAAEVDSKVGEITDADVDAFYQENQGRIRQPKEQVAPQIQQYLASQRHEQVMGDLMDGLEKKHKVAILLEPPRREVEAVGPAKGPASAPITIVEFSDFECPFCSRVVPTLDKVTEEYGDNVRLVFRQFPLDMHPNARKAAEAALCANEQGKFWEMHDLMFEEQRKLQVADLKAKAEVLELDAEKFNQCLDSGEFADEVAADMQAGARAGVSGTPAMFVNGIFISGAVPYEQIAQVIDEELARKGVEN
jgi:protein-disulfide isomerase